LLGISFRSIWINM